MSWRNSKPFYKSGKDPKFAVGDILYLWEQEKTKTIGEIRHWCEPHEIISVSTKKSGFIFTEFTYTVRRCVDCKIIKKVYESEFEEQKKDDWIEKVPFF